MTDILMAVSKVIQFSKHKLPDIEVRGEEGSTSNTPQFLPGVRNISIPRAEVWDKFDNFLTR